MIDRVSPLSRSANMSRIRSADTKPELIVRRLLHSLGYRYRVGVRGMPGKPDIVFQRRQKVIFVHGCFWHQHAGCRNASMPKSNVEFWQKKLGRNIQRDQEVLEKLAEAGWSTMVVWECETLRIKQLQDRLVEFLGVRQSR